MSHLKTQRCQAFFFLLMNELNNESITEIAARVRDRSPDCITVFQALAYQNTRTRKCYLQHTDWDLPELVTGS